MDHVAHFVHGHRDRPARTEILHALFVSGDAAVIDAPLLRLRLAEAESPLDMGVVAADLGMDLAGDEIAALDRPRRRQPERMRIGQRSQAHRNSVGSSPPFASMASSCRHRLPTPSRPAARCRGRSRASGRRAARRGASIASSSSLLTVRSISIMSSRLTKSACGKTSFSRMINAVRQPAVRIERTGEAVHADAALGRAQVPSAARRPSRPGPPPRTHIAKPSPAPRASRQRRSASSHRMSARPCSGNTSTLNSALPPIGDR